MKVEYNDRHKRVLDGLLLGLPGVRAGRMFGFPGYYADGKLFACVYGPGVALKLPPGRAEKLVGRPGIGPFAPLGRKMKAWVMIERRRSGDLRRLERLFVESAAYVTGARVSGRRWPGKEPRR